MIREYRREDLPVMADIWVRCFGDSERFVSRALEMLPDIGTAAVAEAGGEVVGAAYAICGMELIISGSNPPVVGYIYAVGVREEHRKLGLGRSLTLKAAELARARGAKIICTLPAEDSLYAWYKDVLDIDCVLRRRAFETDSSALEPVMELSSTEYMLWRELLLRGKPHIHFSNHALEFQRVLCREYGGGFYACAAGIAAACMEDGTCVIKELISSDDSALGSIAASVGACLGSGRVRYYIPCVEGEKYIAAQAGGLPPDCVWNLSFD